MASHDTALNTRVPCFDGGHNDRTGPTVLQPCCTRALLRRSPLFASGSGPGVVQTASKAELESLRKAHEELMAEAASGGALLATERARASQLEAERAQLGQEAAGLQRANQVSRLGVGMGPNAPQCAWPPLGLASD